MKRAFSLLLSIIQFGATIRHNTYCVIRSYPFIIIQAIEHLMPMPTQNNNFTYLRTIRLISHGCSQQIKNRYKFIKKTQFIKYIYRTEIIKITKTLNYATNGLDIYQENNLVNYERFEVFFFLEAGSLLS